LANKDVISLRSTYTNRYVVAEPAGNADVDRTGVGNWERFTVELQ
jgi:hypothetical protein